MTTLDPHTQHIKLARLANFLDDLPHDRFHMPKWADTDATPTHCGTAACACGWAATVYHSDGLRVHIDEYKVWNGVEFVHDNVEYVCEDAFEVFFCIDAEHAWRITQDWGAYSRRFGTNQDGTDITPRHAAEMIREVLREVDPKAMVDAEGMPKLCETAP